MQTILLRTYQLMPPFARSIAATLWGYHLRFWRYGPETESLVAEALVRENWYINQWHSWQEERLAYILHCAATKVPFYREQWQKRRRRGDMASWEYLQNWPVLRKESIRHNPRAFVAEDKWRRKMHHEQTSGTTGTPLHLWMSRQTVRSWYALFEARVRRWNRFSYQDPWAILGGQLVTPVQQKKPPFWVWNGALNQLYLSSYHLSPDSTGHYLKAIKRYRIKYIYGYPSALHMLAQGVLMRSKKDVQIHLVITNAEPLYEFQRLTIQRAFQCPVRETYGMSEIVAAASECENGRLHLWPEVGILEIDNSHSSKQQSSSGDFICTGLINEEMPLIRYHVGDCGEVAKENAHCSCGRRLPVLLSVYGRSDDVLYTADGRMIPRLDPVFKANLALLEAQIIQEKLDKVCVRYVPAEGFSHRMRNEIIRNIKMRLGEVEVVFERVKRIPRTRNGKFRAVLCQVPKDELLRVAQNTAAAGENDAHIASK